MTEKSVAVAVASPSLPSFPSVESLSPAESKKRLAQHAKNIRLFHRGAVKGAAELYGYAYLCGKEMLAAKDALPHGNKDPEAGLTKWLADEFPEMSDRQCRRWMEFARAWDAARAALPNAPKAPLQLTNPKGKLTKAAHKEVIDFVPTLMDGKSMTQFMRDSKLARDPEPQKHTPPAELTAEEKVAAQVAHIELLVNAATEQLTLLSDMSAADRAMASPAVWETLQSAWLRLAPVARDLSKAKSKSK